MTERSKEDLYSKCRYMLTEKFALEALRRLEGSFTSKEIADKAVELADAILDRLGIRPE